ncbi:MAG TPA: CBS domain-containing protein [Nitrospirota bacterium]|nr:CBS domain-containing protein [Nitrospirota bacterium]
MKVSTLLDSKGKDVFSVDCSKTIEDAISIMGERKISAIIVTENGKPAGIFTERDVVRSYLATKGRSFKEIKVCDHMITNLITASPDEDVNNIAATMVEKNIRHLPVKHDDRIVGMLSARDIIQATVKKLKSDNKYLKGYITGTISPLGHDED